jgi:hypothetical protein
MPRLLLTVIQVGLVIVGHTSCGRPWRARSLEGLKSSCMSLIGPSEFALVTFRGSSDHGPPPPATGQQRDGEGLIRRGAGVVLRGPPAGPAGERGRAEGPRGAG